MKKMSRGIVLSLFFLLLFEFGRTDEVWASHQSRLSVSIKGLNQKIEGKTVLGNGTVHIAPPGVVCSKTQKKNCKQRYLTNTVVSLVASPDPKSVFVEWQGKGCSGGVATKSITLKGDISCKAFFRPVTSPCVWDGAASKWDHCNFQ